MELRILLMVLLCSCMAVACHESHLDASSEVAFQESWMHMGGEHAVGDAQALGRELSVAENKLGKDNVRRMMNGMDYAQAKAFLDTATQPPKEVKKG
jgi:hypothetical protein